jgi:hypothetical protein
MKKLVIALIVLAFAAPLLAVDLYPTVDVTASKKTQAVLGVCVTQGYTEGTVEGGDFEDASSCTVVTSGVDKGTITCSQWTDSAAQLAFFRAHLNEVMKKTHARAAHRTAATTLPAEDTYDIGIE